MRNWAQLKAGPVKDEPWLEPGAVQGVAALSPRTKNIAQGITNHEICLSRNGLKAYRGNRDYSQTHCGAALLSDNGMHIKIYNILWGGFVPLFDFVIC